MSRFQPMPPEDLTGAALASHLAADLEWLHRRRLKRVEQGRLHHDVAMRLRAKDLAALDRLRASDLMVITRRAAA